MPSVLVRRDSEFGLLRDIEKRTQILGRSLEGCWGPAPRPPGFIALRHQQVLLNGLAGFERTEAGVAAEGSHCAGWSPAQWGSENLATASLRRSGCFPAEPCPPERHRSIRQGQAGVARLFEALKTFPAVGGQLVFAELLPACDHVPHESPSGGLPTCPVVSHSLWQSEVAEQRSQFSLSSDSQSRRSDHGCRGGPSVDSRVPIGFF